MTRSFEEYKNNMRDYVITYQKELKHLEEFSKGKNWIDIYSILGDNLAPVMEFPHMETMPCFVWCYTNDIHYKIIMKETTALDPETFSQRKFLFIEFKDKASMVAFKMRWEGCPNAAAGRPT